MKVEYNLQCHDEECKEALLFKMYDLLGIWPSPVIGDHRKYVVEGIAFEDLEGCLPPFKEDCRCYVTFLEVGGMHEEVVFGLVKVLLEGGWRIIVVNGGDGEGKELAAFLRTCLRGKAHVRYGNLNPLVQVVIDYKGSCLGIPKGATRIRVCRGSFWLDS